MSFEKCFISLAKELKKHNLDKLLTEEVDKLKKQYAEAGDIPAEEIAKRAERDAAKNIINNIQNESFQKASSFSESRSVGAAEVDFGEGRKIANLPPGVVKFLTGAGIEANTPLAVRGLQSPSKNMNTLTDKIMDHNFILERELEGKTRGDIADVLTEADLSEGAELSKRYLDLFTSQSGSKIKSILGKAAPGRLSLREFDEQVSRGIWDDTFKSEIKEVNNATELLKRAYDKKIKQLRDNKVLDEAITDADAKNFFTQIFDIDKLANPALAKKFINKVSAYLEQLPENRGLSKAEIQEIAEDTYRKLIGTGDSLKTIREITEDFTKSGKITGKYKVKIPNKEISEFLITDQKTAFDQFWTRASRISNTKKALNDVGFDSIGDVKKAIEEDYNDLINKAADESSRKELIKKFNNDKKLVDNIYEYSLGNLNKKRNRIFQGLGSYQFTRLLGGVSLSSIPDLALLPLRIGFTNYFTDVLKPLITNFKAVKLSSGQFKDLGLGVQAQMDNVIFKIAGLDKDVNQIANSFDRTVDALTGTFAHATGVTLWTSMGERLSAHAASAGIIRRVLKIAKGEVDSKDLRELAQLGISKSDVAKIADQVNKYSTNVDGSYIANHYAWTDQEAKKLFESGVLRLSRNVILKPKGGDLPLWAQESDLGRLIFQFKSFMSAASGRITVRALQKRDADALTGVIALVSMGMLTRIIKDKVAGRDTDYSFPELVAEGFSSSGALGWILTTPLDVWLNLVNDKTRRYGGGFAQALVGPSVSQLFELQNLTGRLLDGKVSNSDARAVGRLLPFQNIFYLQSIFDKVFPKKRNR